MSSIASGMNAERTNRWLLIGAAVLGLGAAVLVFLLLANVGGDDNGSSASGGDVSVLVASQTIPANTEITESMFEVQTVKSSQAIPTAAETSSQVIGRASTSEIVEGQQISLDQVANATSDDISDAGLATVIDHDRVAFTLSANEVSNVAGFVQAGDYVNVVGVFKVEGDQLSGAAGGDFTSFTRVETLLQHVEVLAVAQAPVDAVPAPEAASSGDNPDAQPTATTSERARPDEVDPNPDAGSVTVHLSQADAQLLAAARAEGEVFLELRSLSDPAIAQLQPVCFDTFGSFTCPPARRRLP